jgi:hypothetical protein
MRKAGQGDERLVEVWRAWGDAEVQIVRGLLDANGIESAIRGESTRLFYGFTLDGLAEVRILVHEPDAQYACELIAAADGMTLCSSCGKPAAQQDRVCRFCRAALPGE